MTSLRQIIDEAFAPDHWRRLCDRSLTKPFRQIIDDVFATYHWRRLCNRSLTTSLRDIIATSSILSLRHHRSYLCDDIVNRSRARATNIYDFFIPFILWFSPMPNVNSSSAHTISYLCNFHTQFFPPFIFWIFSFFDWFVVRLSSEEIRVECTFNFSKTRNSSYLSALSPCRSIIIFRYPLFNVYTYILPPLRNHLRSSIFVLYSIQCRTRYAYQSGTTFFRPDCKRAFMEFLVCCCCYVKTKVWKNKNKKKVFRKCQIRSPY